MILANGEQQLAASIKVHVVHNVPKDELGIFLKNTVPIWVPVHKMATFFSFICQ